MPCSTSAEKQTIFDRVLQMPSFSKHLSHPKLANWFAWNKSACEQIGEFHAGKMVYESQLINDANPDDCGSFEVGVGVVPTVGGSALRID